MPSIPRIDVSFEETARCPFCNEGMMSEDMARHLNTEHRALHWHYIDEFVQHVNCPK